MNCIVCNKVLTNEKWYAYKIYEYFPQKHDLKFDNSMYFCKKCYLKNKIKIGGTKE